MRSPQPRVVTLVLCSPEGAVLGALPPFEAALPWWQEVEGLVAWTREHHGVDATVLRLLEAALPAPPGGAVSYLAEVGREAAVDLALVPWTGAAPVGPHPLRLSYAEPGGPGRDVAWAEEILRSRGIRQVGPAHQVRTWNLSSLWRMPVESGMVWLKCVPPFFAHEGAVIQALGDAPVPRLLAHEAGRILMPEIPGQDLYDASGDTLGALVSILVDLQGRWVGREADLLALGLPDWRATALSASIGSVVRRCATHLTEQDRTTLDAFVADLPSRFSALAECGIPDSLVHGDFAPGNTRGSGSDGGTLVVLDWGDCGVGHPFLDQSAFLDRIDPGEVERVQRHWAELWRDAAPGSDPARAAALVAPVAAARQAVIYQGFLDRIEPSEHPYHRADPAFWLTRTAGLARGSGTC